MQARAGPAGWKPPAGTRPACWSRRTPPSGPGDAVREGDTEGGSPGTARPGPEPPRAQRPHGRLRAAASRPVVRHLALIVIYLAAGIAATWPRASYLTDHQLPETRDVSGYVWDLWWTAHQIVHLGNPWFTNHMAAPVGIQLGFDTTMPLAGLIMTPVTLIFGPSAAFSLLTIVLPGLLCYVMYRAARLWLAEPGAIAAGAFFGLSSMVAWQDWQHLNIALGTLFLPMTLEAAVRLRRTPGLRQGVILGVVLGASVLVNQESAVMAGLLAAAALLPWLIRHPRAARLRALGACAARRRRDRQPAAHRHGPAGRRGRRVGRRARAGPYRQELRRGAFRSVRSVAAGGQLRAARPGRRGRERRRAHRRGHADVRRGAQRAGAVRPGRFLAAAQRLAARRALAGLRLARPGRDPLRRPEAARALADAVARRAGVADHALHVVHAHPVAVGPARGRPVRPTRAGRRGPAGRGRGGLALASRPAR